MGLYLLWIESLAAGLLLVASVLAWTAHFRWRISQAFLPIIISLGLALVAGSLTGFAIVARSRATLLPGTFWYFTTWSVTLSAGLLVILNRGLTAWRNEASPKGGSASKSLFAIFGFTLLWASPVLVAVSTSLGALALFRPEMGPVIRVWDFLDWRFNATMAGFGLAFALILTIAPRLRGKRPEATAIPHARTWPLNRLLIAFLVATALSSLTFMSMDAAVKTQLAGMRAESGSKILALIPSRVPDAENAALLYQQAFDRMPSRGIPAAQLGDKAIAWLDSTKPFDIHDKDLIETLESQQPTLSLLRQGAARPSCYFERNWFDVNALLPEVQNMRHGANLVALQARFDVRQGRVRSAIEDVMTLFRLAQHAKEPYLVATWNAGVIDQLAVTCMEDVFNTASFQLKDLDAFSIPEVSYHLAFRRGILMSQADFGQLMFSALSFSDDTWKRLGLKRPSPVSFFATSPFYRVFILLDDAAAYQRYMNQFENASQSPYWVIKDYWERADERFKEDRGGLFTALFMFELRTVGRSAAKSDAYHGLAQFALAAERYRLKHGRLPERPEEVIPAFLPAIPLDPFDGQSLRFKRDGKDVILYSIGPDDVDDGGIPWNEAAKKGDLVFRIKGR